MEATKHARSEQADSNRHLTTRALRYFTCEGHQLQVKGRVLEDGVIQLNTEEPARTEATNVQVWVPLTDYMGFAADSEEAAACREEVAALLRPASDVIAKEYWNSPEGVAEARRLAAEIDDTKSFEVSA